MGHFYQSSVEIPTNREKLPLPTLLRELPLDLGHQGFSLLVQTPPPPILLEDVARDLSIGLSGLQSPRLGFQNKEPCKPSKDPPA